MKKTIDDMYMQLDEIFGPEGYDSWPREAQKDYNLLKAFAVGLMYAQNYAGEETK